MEEAQAFAKSLEERLAVKRESLDRNDLPKLRDSVKLYQSAYAGLYGVLFKKGIIHDDPYQYEVKTSEVMTPPEGPFSEAEKVDQMSLRMSQFQNSLEFLNNYYQFTVEFLTMGRIKRILALMNYFNFGQMSESSNNLNTRCLAELANMVKRGSDQLSSGILAESTTQLERATKEIYSALKDLTAWHRESYKLELRNQVMSGLSFDPTFVITHRDEVIKQVKKRFTEVAGDRPFFAELAEEVLMEDYSSEASSLRDAVFNRLAVKEEKKTEKKEVKSYRILILEAMRMLAGISYPLEDSIQKLAENSAILESEKQGFLWKLKTAFLHLFSPQAPGLSYDIEIIDTITGGKTSESIDFRLFTEESLKKVKQIATYLQRGGVSWKKLESASEEQAFLILERSMEEIQRLLKRIMALDEAFRAACPAEERSRLRGIKAETTTIKGSLIKVNQKKHEYVAYQEELEQMRKLGIRSQ